MMLLSHPLIGKKLRLKLLFLFFCTGGISFYFGVLYINLFILYTTTSVTSINHKIYPRMIFILQESNLLHSRNIPKEECNKDEWNVKFDEEEYKTTSSGNFSESCSFMLDWQTSFNPTCNLVHEIDFHKKTIDENLSKFREGSQRVVWVLQNVNNKNVIALKTLRLDKPLKKVMNNMYSFQQTDAVITERLTFSPQFLNIYSFCGFSAINEFAGYDSKPLNKLSNSTAPKTKLKYSRDIAHALTDMHNIQGLHKATFVHRDLGPSNVMIVKGQIKIYDFNEAYMLKWDTITNSPCFYSDFICGLDGRRSDIRSPEECLGKQITEKIDIYAMGALFFFILTKKRAYHFNPNSTENSIEWFRNLVTSNNPPLLPSYVEASNDPAINVIRTAMKQTMSFDPIKRPSAIHVANYLDQKLKELVQKA